MSESLETRGVFVPWQQNNQQDRLEVSGKKHASDENTDTPKGTPKVYSGRKESQRKYQVNEKERNTEDKDGGDSRAKRRGRRTTSVSETIDEEHDDHKPQAQGPKDKRTNCPEPEHTGLGIAIRATRTKRKHDVTATVYLDEDQRRLDKRRGIDHGTTNRGADGIDDDGSLCPPEAHHPERQAEPPGG